MKAESFSIGTLPWTNDELISHLEEFSELYKKRPISDNQGGQLSAQLFYSWFVAKKLQPQFIIESGVWKGQGTWAFEQASPNSQIICLDPYPKYQQGYVSKKATYVHHDFFEIDWSTLNKENVLCFFDDHQNSAARLQACRDLGFKKIMFEDNYPPGQGDCFSLKKLFEDETSLLMVGDKSAKDFFSSFIKTYQEMPPIFILEKNRWNLPWDTYKSKLPLLEIADKPYLETYKDEMYQYTWINYVELK
jgi:hypothetical protein